MRPHHARWFPRRGWHKTRFTAKWLDLLLLETQVEILDAKIGAAERRIRLRAMDKARRSSGTALEKSHCMLRQIEKFRKADVREFLRKGGGRAIR